MHVGGSRSGGTQPLRVLGRSDELARIENLVRGTVLRSGRLLLAGEPGIGKTSLLGHGETLARAAGHCVLVARPTEVEQRLPFAVLGDLIHGLDISRLTSGRRAALDVALGLQASDNMPPHAHHVGLALLDLVGAELTAGRPVTFVIDDVQWIDSASREPLEFAFRRLPEAGVTVLIAQRMEHLDAARAVFPVTSDEVLRLQPLPADVTEDLVRTVIPADVSAHALSRIVATADGNPLYAIEFARAARDVLGEPGRPLPVPASLASVTASRLAGLPAATQHALALVSMLARPTVDTVAELGVLEDLRAAEIAGVVALSGRAVRFTHPVLASAAYSATTGTDRLAWHARLATVTDGTEHLIHRALAATASAGPLADDLLVAAQRESARGANHEAADIGALAWGLSPPTEQRHWARAVTVGDLFFRAGRTDDAVALLEDARQWTDDDAIRARALLSLASIRYANESDTSVAAWYARACLELATDITTRIEAHAILSRCEYLDFTEALHHAEVAVALLREQPKCNPALQASVLTAAAATRFNAGLGVDRAGLEHAIALERNAEVIGADSAFGTLAALLKYADDVDTSIEMFDRLARDADPASVPYALGHLPQLHLWRGDIGAAEEAAHRGLRIALDTHQDGHVEVADYNIALLDVVRGRYALANDVAERLAARGRDLDIPWTERMGVSLLGFIAACQDDPTLAVRHFVRYDDLGEQIRLFEPGYHRNYGDYIESLVLAGERHRAEEVLTRIGARAERVGRVSVLAMVARGRALTAVRDDQRDAALAHAQHAVDLVSNTSLGYELARAQLVLGTVARWAQHRSLARDVLDQAVTAFEMMGAEPFAVRARRERDRISGRPRPATQPNVLTPTEEAVASLATAGRTTRQIAESMHVSAKTVESHLTSIYRKTGVSSRAQLAARRMTTARAPSGG
jgi:DNA-binding CsgD family transcriptional regulator/tetratricopeptide (TPR) repeat protein